MNVISKFKKDKKEGLQNCGMASLTSIPGNETGAVILQTISRHMKSKEAIGTSCGSIKEKSYFTK